MTIEAILIIIQEALRLSNTVSQIILTQIQHATPEQQAAMGAAQVTIMQNHAAMITFWQDVFKKLQDGTNP